ncbi:helix-turn-helix domain-containing protein [Photobacterium sp. WH77]|uniref:AraC family transcriptional regulator n=1 Tax=Photobacterium arenosum TaxID=2774143 RepID=A0ABR9BQJ9_9GAMM|nr:MULTISPECIES: helix-turn-helix domain-containing protein [Photobacterium]MBD8513756.1 AraC family transcriptional regulator [Photobacterium arenosum]MCG2837672.1 helix-turn-helix domain-containing protein [Photobacterium sp. WH77]MCG2845288.1 helix-turn-helix domain-containing protein [Photobacterium sp. WH80]
MDFRIFKPQGVLKDHVQGIWSLSVSPDRVVEEKKLLFSDAGSGIMFNLGGDVCFGNHCHPEGVMIMPNSKEAQYVTLPPGTVLAGIRFHPGMGYSVLGKRFDHPVTIADEPEHLYFLEPLQQQLRHCRCHQARIATLYRWMKRHLDPDDSARHTITEIVKAVQPHSRHHPIPVSTRQIERHFQKWMGMTPKYYQRILRVKQSLELIQLSPDIPLADLAAEQGFSDQAHMTREFSHIAKITPKQYSLLVKKKQVQSR